MSIQDEFSYELEPNGKSEIFHSELAHEIRICVNYHFDCIIGATIPGFTNRVNKASAVVNPLILTKEKLKVFLEALRLELMINYVNVS